MHRDRLGFAGIRMFLQKVLGMTEAVLSELETGYDVLISSAAIADYTAEPSPEKIKWRRVCSEAEAHPEIDKGM